MNEGFFIQVIEELDSPFAELLERFPEGFPALMLADQISSKLYPARFKRSKSGDIFWLLVAFGSREACSPAATS